MKRNRLILTGALALALAIPALAADTEFTDVQPNDWYYSAITQAVADGVVNGYEDGTFKPDATISYAEYLTMLVRALGLSTDTVVPEGSMWYTGTQLIASENGLTVGSVIGDYNGSLTRQEAAKFTEIGMSISDSMVTYNNLSSYITDYDEISSNYSTYVLKQYARGMLSGDENGNFNATSTLTRAQAVTIVMRILDESSRVTVDTLVEETETEVDTSTWTTAYTEGIYEGVMRIEIATEYDYEALSSANFYMENGKYMISLTLPELPEGYSWKYSVGAYDSDNNYIYYSLDRETMGVTGYQEFEVYSKYDSRTMADMSVTTLTVFVYNENNEKMVSHTISTTMEGKVCRQSAVNTSDMEWLAFDTSSIFNW